MALVDDTAPLVAVVGGEQSQGMAGKAFDNGLLLFYENAGEDQAADCGFKTSDQQVGKAQSEQDIEACRQLADRSGVAQHKDGQVGQKAAKGAVLGGVGSAAWGLVRGGDAAERELPEDLDPDAQLETRDVADDSLHRRAGHGVCLAALRSRHRGPAKSR